MESPEFNVENNELFIGVECISPIQSIVTSDCSLDGKQSSVIAAQFRYCRSEKFLNRLVHNDPSTDILVGDPLNEIEEASCVFDMSDSSDWTDILFVTVYESFSIILDDEELDGVMNEIITASGLDLNECGGQVKKATVKVHMLSQLTMVRCEECLAIDESIETAEFEAENRLVPASESSIKKLKRVRIMEDDEEEKHQDKKRRGKSSYKVTGNVGVKASDCCSICLDEFVSAEELVTGEEFATQMPCSHAFHKECIEAWLSRSHYCPLCRFEMPPADDDDYIVDPS